jgi:hypothetical protein
MGGGAVRSKAIPLVLAGATLVLLASGCAIQSTGSSAPAAPPPVRASGVRVPDVLAAVRDHKFTNTYDSDPSATAGELEGYVNGLLESSGLKADFALQPIAVPDSQEPTAGTMVPRGSVIRVRIGFGD